MDKCLLDTDLLSEVMKAKDPRVLERARTYLSNHKHLTFSAVTVMEVVKGLHKVGRSDALSVFLSNLDRSEVLVLDSEAGVLAGRIYADLERTGKTIGRADPMIAGTAIRHGLILVSGNLDHYARIQALGYPLVLDNWRS